MCAIINDNNYIITIILKEISVDVHSLLWWTEFENGKHDDAD